MTTQIRRQRPWTVHRQTPPGGAVAVYVAGRFSPDGRWLECGHKHRLERKAVECVERLNFGERHKGRTCMRPMMEGGMCGEPASWFWHYIRHIDDPGGDDRRYYCDAEGHRQPGSKRIPDVPH